MYVFELYARRLVKRKLVLTGMVMLPVLLALLLAKLYEPNQVEQFSSMMSGMIGILTILALISTMMFYSDKQHKTAQRIFLSTLSKLSFYGQKVLVFLVISMLQLLAMVLAVERLLPSKLELAFMDYLILFSAYCLLIIITAGVGLIAKNLARSDNGKGLILTIIGCALFLICGLIGASIELPFIFNSMASIVPTYWLTEVISIIFDDPGRHIEQLLGYMVSLLLCAGLILLLLCRTRTERL